MDESSQPEVKDAPPLAEPAPVAWQPFTPRGVGAFASAGFGWLFLMELAVAALAAGTMLWFLSAIWFPVVREAIRHLPEKGVIVWGELNWPGHKFDILAERRPFLIFVVDLERLSRGSSGADLSVRFHTRDLEISGLFGSLIYPYPKEYEFDFNRLELEPAWEAWRPSLLGWTALLTPVVLFLVWAALATLYSPVAWLIGIFRKRELSWGGSWRLCSAALMPGALLLSGAILLYGVGVLDLFHLLLATGLHLITGWVYFVTATLQLPKLAERTTTTANPFSPSGTGAKRKDNPFAPP